MILSASRRTDLPNYYANWLIHRLQEGFVLVRNPMNPHQISRIPLSPSVVDCIVFWTKNPENMLSRLGDLSAYPYYFQFTLTSYGRDIEPYLPGKKDCLIPVFQSLAARIGKERMVWRYDPILLNTRYTVSYHLNAFTQIAERLRGCTEKVVISFVDLYSKTQRNTRGLSITPPQGKVLLNMVQHLVRIAATNGMVVETCSETIDLQDLGVQHGHCIDARQIERIIGVPLRGKKDRNQRVTCGCMESIDIGAYHTCGNGCKYCYANFSQQKVAETVRLYKETSPLLCGQIGPKDYIIERSVQSLREEQLRFDGEMDG